MRFRARKRFRFGPFFVNFSASGGRPRFTSWGLKVWRWTWNVTRGTHTVDTPGMGSLHFGGSKRRRKAATSKNAEVGA